MFTKYLKQHGGKDPVSNLSKSLLSTNYENVTLPGANTPPQTKRSNSNETTRKSYENVSIHDSSDKVQLGVSARQPSEVSPPPKPGRHAVNRRTGGGQNRPVSSIEPASDQKHLSPPIATARKHSAPPSMDAKQTPPPKPALTKKPSDPKPRKNLNSPQKTFGHDKPLDTPSSKHSQPVAKAKPLR